jgi:hypothetical protein
MCARDSSFVEVLQLKSRREFLTVVDEEFCVGKKDALQGVGLWSAFL